MSDAFSSQEAEEKDKEQFDSLEEYILNTSREKEKESAKSIRFRDWQEMQLNIIRNKMGTNTVEVVARSYLMGLARLRNQHHDDVEGLSEMLVEFLMVVGSDSGNNESVDYVHSELSDYTVEEPPNLKGELSEPKRYSIRESALSEVENNYVENSFFGGWIHRYVAALGFLDSKFVTNTTEDYLSSFSSAVSESMDGARDEIESMIQDFISMSQAYWVTEGVNNETLEDLKKIVDMMETDRKETCERLLEHSEHLLKENTED